MLGERIGRLPAQEEADWASGYEACERAGDTGGVGMIRQARSLLQSAWDLRRSDRPSSLNRQAQARPAVAQTEGYDGFISYSHARDGRLAPALQRGLHRFAKPWHRRRALRVFRDETNLAADPGLWSSIEQALASSRFFILLASPDAAASKWVDKEVRWWRSHKPLANLLVVLTDGDLVWDDVTGDFDWNRTTAVPMAVKGGFREEPHYIDLRWARTAEHLSLTDPRFRGCVARPARSEQGRPVRRGRPPAPPHRPPGQLRNRHPHGPDPAGRQPGRHCQKQPAHGGEAGPAGHLPVSGLPSRRRVGQPTRSVDPAEHGRTPDRGDP
jgi:hypothetical protein